MLDADIGKSPKELMNFNSIPTPNPELELNKQKGIGIDPKNKFYQLLPLVTTNLSQPLIIPIDLKIRLDIRCVIRAEIKC